MLPKEVVEELELVEGSKVAFKRERGVVVVKKVEESNDSLREVMSWNPERKGKLRPVTESEIKEVWKTG